MADQKRAKALACQWGSSPSSGWSTKREAQARNWLWHTSSIRTGGACISSPLAWPWLRTAQGADLPGQLEAPDGLLAGLVARNALARGTFRSVAGTPLPAVFGTEPVLPWSAIAATATDALARRVCVIAPQPGGGWAVRERPLHGVADGWQQIRFEQGSW